MAILNKKEQRALRTILTSHSRTKQIFALLTLVLTISACLMIPRSGAELNGLVVAVADGDTITILDSQREKHKIRLAYIDAPEKNQAYGQKSKQFLSNLIYRKQVRIKVTEKDHYGRELGQVWLENKDVNLLIIEQGYAWHYTYYARKNQSTKDFQQYEHAQSYAQNNRLGLWQGNDPVSPWDFRHQKRKK